MTSQLYLIRLTREDTSIPWGFRLEGGVDIGHAVNIQRVSSGSIADYGGLRQGDHVVRINSSETKWMRHEDAKMEIIRSGNDVEMLIERGQAHLIQSLSSVTIQPTSPWARPVDNTPKPTTAIWQPKVVPVATHSYMTAPEMHTSLEAPNGVNSDRAIGVRHNISPVPFGQTPPSPGQTLVAQTSDGRFKQIKHSAYNSPMGLYAKRNLNETFQKTVYSASGPNVHPTDSAVPKAESGIKYCGSCGEFIRDVFIKVQGRVPMHPHCLKCCKCGVGLRNVGYFFINDKLYCERHAKQAAPPPEPGMKPVVVYK